MNSSLVLGNSCILADVSGGGAVGGGWIFQFWSSVKQSLRVSYHGDCCVIDATAISVYNNVANN